jgi:hypothetical protein
MRPLPASLIWCSIPTLERAANLYAGGDAVDGVAIDAEAQGERASLSD